MVLCLEISKLIPIDCESGTPTCLIVYSWPKNHLFPPWDSCGIPNKQPKLTFHIFSELRRFTETLNQLGISE